MRGERRTEERIVKPKGARTGRFGNSQPISFAKTEKVRAGENIRGVAGQSFGYKDVTGMTHGSC